MSSFRWTILGFFATALVLFDSAACVAAPAKIGPEAAWQPGNQFIAEVHRACGSPKAGDLRACFVDQMQRAGAPEAATTFARMLSEAGYLRVFRHVGDVDIAYVEYPFRANENEGVLLVNGTPNPIDVDDAKRYPADSWKSDPAAPRETDAILFPGDRFNVTDPVALSFQGGSQEFIENYRLQTCHTCAVLGYVFFSFEFNSHGNFHGAKYVVFTPGEAATAGDVWNPIRPVPIHGKTVFTLWLPAHWQLIRHPNPEILRPLEENGPNYSFQAVATGSAYLSFRSQAGKVIEFAVTIQP